MATARLSDDEKQRICNSVNKTTDRALFNKEFPVPKDDAFNWLVKQLPKAIAKAYTLLRADAPQLTNRQAYGCDFHIQSDTHQYRIAIDSDVPMNHIMILHNDSYHADIIKWVEWEVVIKKNIEDGQGYMSTLVWSCTSAGQLKRLLPEEIMRFIPKYLLDFSEVERRSRIPASFTPDPEKLEAMMNILTLGSLSPDKNKGMKAWSERVTELNTE